MISRKTLFSILLGIAGVLIMTWRIGLLPARVVIINQSGVPIANVAVVTDDGRTELGTIDNGQTKHVALGPTATLRVSYTFREPKVWAAPKGLSAGQSVGLYLNANGAIEPRDRIGSYAR